MSNSKLQELTDHLYAQGLAKGRQEAEQILAQAKAKADEILAQAQAQAEKILADAGAKAQDLAAKAQSDVKMASSQALDITKASIIDAIQTKSVDAAVEKVLSNEEFTKEFIMAVAKAFSTEKNCDLSVVIPETLRNHEGYIRKEVAEAVGKNVEVTLSKKIKGGLNIGPKDGGYYVSLSDETFSSLIREYLRPATRKVLFGE